jgi:dipeptidyl aminopeptidase/acylaminoacyl peptidase
MRRIAICLLLLLASLPAQAQRLEPPQYVTDPKQIVSKAKDPLGNFSVEKLFMTRHVGPTAWSPDGQQIVFVSNLTGRHNLWLVPAGGGWPMQLTVSDQRQTSPAWSPDGVWIAYASDYESNEQWDIFLVSPESGEVVNLTGTAEIAERAPAWSPDGRKLAYEVKPKTSPTYEIHVLDVATRKTVHLTRATAKHLSNFNPLWSPDGKQVAYTQIRAGFTDSNIFVADAATGAATNLTPHTGEQVFQAAAWLPDGKSLLVTSNALNGFDNAGVLDIATKRIDWLTRENWDVDAGGVSRDGLLAVMVANVDGNLEAYTADLRSRKLERIALPRGVVELGGAESPFSRDGKLLLYYEGPNAPRDAWVWKPGRQPQQVTRSLIAGLKSGDMVEPYLVRCPSRDGKYQISAFLYVPYNQSPERKTPAIVLVHGGPASQHRNTFNRFVQYIVNQGYLVVAPNVRGSTGYGKAFMEANRRDLGGGDLQDVLAAAEWVKRTPYADPKKLVIMGGSYGGYMTMMGLAKAPAEWAAGVALVPLVDWETLVSSTDPFLREYVGSLLGDPVKDKALYRERSPINFIDQVKAPLLILAGGRDPRCPPSQAQQIADSIRKNGGTALLKIYENEGHGFARIENQIDAWKEVSDFLKVRTPAPGCHAGGACSIYE